MNNLQGVWLPIITPFYHGEIDFSSYKKLIDYYTEKGITGLIPNGTTGECPTIEEYELEELLAKTAEYNNNRLPVYVGLGGNNTRKVIKQLKLIEKYGFEGILSVSPYYSRPDQTGIYEHFKAISASTTLKIIIYNIPYRTGRNIENDTLFKLAELKNIIGVKDSCGNINQTLELINNKPANFAVLTGEDVLFYVNLALGGDGGILAAAHLETEKFVQIRDLMNRNDHQAALKIWNTIESFIPLLFKEPNPAPIKYLLARQGLIKSEELRLPLTTISEQLKAMLNTLPGMTK
jgi:4-hydroxy-tetrahydrodipicolinate synthase